MSKLLLDEQPLVILPKLAVKIGLNEAILLQQLNYWLQSSKHEIDGRRWVYNTIEAWQNQFPFWSEKTIRRTITSLVNKGIIIKGNYNEMKIDRTLWYSIDFEKFNEIIKDTPSGQIDHMENLGDTLTEPSGQIDHMVKDKLTKSEGQIDHMVKDKLTTPITREYTENTTESIREERSPHLPQYTNEDILNYLKNKFGSIAKGEVFYIAYWLEKISADLMMNIITSQNFGSIGELDNVFIEYYIKNKDKA